MLKKELEKTKARLEKERQEIVKELESFADKKKKLKNWSTRFPNFQGSNLEEEADEVEEYENLISIEKTFETKLGQIDLALERIKNKEYGICQSCAKQISQERLEAMPETNFCSDCKK